MYSNQQNKELLWCHSLTLITHTCSETDFRFAGIEIVTPFSACFHDNFFLEPIIWSLLFLSNFISCKEIALSGKSNRNINFVFPSLVCVYRIWSPSPNTLYILVP